MDRERPTAPSASPQGDIYPVSIGSGETEGSCKSNVLVLLLRNMRPRQETRQGLGRTKQAVERGQQLHLLSLEKAPSLLILIPLSLPSKGPPVRLSYHSGE